MANLSNYAENKLLDHVLGTAQLALPTIYLALFTTDPTDAGAGAEVTDVFGNVSTVLNGEIRIKRSIV